MFNFKPIFLNCFSRGGSNIFWNIFLSHPQACSPIQETLQIFGAGLSHATLDGCLVALLSGQPRLFDQWNLHERRSLSPLVRNLVDRTFERWKMKTLQDEEMKYKAEEQLYTEAEVQSARLVAKDNNGLVFLSQVLLEIYPEATFFALARHPLAVYESHKRHKTPPSRSVQAFAEFYNHVCEQMLLDSQHLPRYYLVRFEDILADPVSCIPSLFAQAGLSFDPAAKLRFKAKPHFQENGQHTTAYQANRHYWFTLDEVPVFFQADINELQIRRLDPKEKQELLRLTEETCQRLGYQGDYLA